MSSDVLQVDLVTAARDEASASLAKTNEQLREMERNLKASQKAAKPATRSLEDMTVGSNKVTKSVVGFAGQAKGLAERLGDLPHVIGLVAGAVTTVIGLFEVFSSKGPTLSERIEQMGKDFQAAAKDSATFSQEIRKQIEALDALTLARLKERDPEAAASQARLDRLADEADAIALLQAKAEESAAKVEQIEIDQAKARDARAEAQAKVDAFREPILARIIASQRVSREEAERRLSLYSDESEAVQTIRSLKEDVLKADTQLADLAATQNRAFNDQVDALNRIAALEDERRRASQAEVNTARDRVGDLRYQLELAQAGTSSQRDAITLSRELVRLEQLRVIAMLEGKTALADQFSAQMTLLRLLSATRGGGPTTPRGRGPDLVGPVEDATAAMEAQLEIDLLRGDRDKLMLRQEMEHIKILDRIVEAQGRGQRRLAEALQGQLDLLMDTHHQALSAYDRAAEERLQRSEWDVIRAAVTANASEMKAMLREDTVKGRISAGTREALAAQTAPEPQWQRQAALDAMVEADIGSTMRELEGVYRDLVSQGKQEAADSVYHTIEMLIEQALDRAGQAYDRIVAEVAAAGDAADRALLEKSIEFGVTTRRFLGSGAEGFHTKPGSTGVAAWFNSRAGGPEGEGQFKTPAANDEAAAALMRRLRAETDLQAAVVAGTAVDAKKSAEIIAMAHAMELYGIQTREARAETQDMFALFYRGTETVHQFGSEIHWMAEAFTSMGRAAETASELLQKQEDGLISTSQATLGIIEASAKAGTSVIKDIEKRAYAEALLYTGLSIGYFATGNVKGGIGSAAAATALFIAAGSSGGKKATPAATAATTTAPSAITNIWNVGAGARDPLSLANLFRRVEAEQKNTGTNLRSPGW